MIAFLEAQNESGMKYRSLSYETTFAFTDAGEPEHVIVNTGTAKVIRSGDSQWAQIDRKLDPTKPDSIVSKAVVTPQFYADWPALHSPYAYRIDNASVADASEQELSQKSFAIPNDIMMYGYGTSIKLFRDAVKARQTTGKWTYEISERENVKFFALKCENPDNSIISFTLDSNKGFLITRYQVFFPNQEVATQIDVAPTLQQDGSWFPTDIDEIRYTIDEKTHSRRVGLHRSFHTSNILVNPQIPKNQFSLEALELDDAVKVLARSVDNEASVLVKSPKGFVPLDLAPSYAVKPQTSVNPTNANASDSQPRPVGSVAITDERNHYLLWLVIAGITVSLIGLCLILWKRKPQSRL